MKNALVIMILFVSGVLYAQEMEDVEVTCPKCNGKKTMLVYEQCLNCGGKALIEEEIHNGDMKYIKAQDSKKPTKTNRKRCPVCIKSSKKGMVKVEKNCDRCSGSGKIAKIKKVLKKANDK